MDALRKGYTNDSINLLKYAEKECGNLLTDLTDLDNDQRNSEKARILGITLNNMACFYKRVNRPKLSLTFFIQSTRCRNDNA